MIVLLNILLPLLIAGILFIGYKKKKLIPALIISLVVGYGYTLVQPSYMPKGTVKSLPPIELRASDKPIQDRMLKPVPAAERDEKMKAEFKASDERREALVEQIKKDKE